MLNYKVNKLFLLGIILLFTLPIIFSAEANIASRTTGAKPLGIFFDAISEYRVFERTSSDITGLSFDGGDDNNPTGTGILEYDENESLRWQAPGDTFGNYVNISTTQRTYVQLISGNNISTIYIYIAANHNPYPTKTTQDTIEITTGNDVGTIQPRGFDRYSKNCFGIEITRISINNELGSGKLNCYDNGFVSWQAPDDQEGDLVNISGDNTFELLSGNGESKINIWVNWWNHSMINSSDEILIVNGGDNADWNAFHFEWNFDDPNSGEWHLGAKKSDGSSYSKNTAFGPIAAHIYNESGTYNATLMIIDDLGNKYYYNKEITVLDEIYGGWTTYYFSNEGNDETGNGSIENPYYSFEKAKSLAEDNTKFLFKRGDSFELSSSWQITETGVFIGAYSSGNRPIINITAPTYFIHGDQGSDIRFLDLNIINTLPIEESRRSSSGFVHLSKDSIYRNIRLQDVGTAFMFTSTYDRTTGAIVQECETDGAIMGVWASSAPKGAVLGSNFSNARTYSGEVEALYRLYNDKMITSHNYYSKPNPTKDSIRFMRNPSGYGRWYIISYNKLDGVTGPAIQGDSYFRMVKQVLIEGNNGAGIGMHGGEYITYRNNRIITDELKGIGGTIDGYNGKDYHHYNLYILNNLLDSTYESIRFFGLSGGVSNYGYNFVIKNNLIHAPLATNAIYSHFIRFGIAGLWGTNLSNPIINSDYNLIHMPSISNIIASTSGRYDLESWQDITGNDIHSLITEQNFLNTNNDNYAPASNESISIDSGISTAYVRIDADQNYRTYGLSTDIGPYEYLNSIPIIETCYDGIINQDETGIDCGGVCDFCPVIINPIHPADTNSTDSSEGIIDLNELVNYIELWKLNTSVSLSNLIEAIKLWKEG